MGAGGAGPGALDRRDARPVWHGSQGGGGRVRRRSALPLPGKLGRRRQLADPPTPRVEQSLAAAFRPRMAHARLGLRQRWTRVSRPATLRSGTAMARRAAERGPRHRVRLLHLGWVGSRRQFGAAFAAGNGGAARRTGRGAPGPAVGAGSGAVRCGCGHGAVPGPPSGWPAALPLAVGVWRRDGRLGAAASAHLRAAGSLHGQTHRAGRLRPGGDPGIGRACAGRAGARGDGGFQRGRGAVLHPRERPLDRRRGTPGPGGWRGHGRAHLRGQRGERGLHGARAGDVPESARRLAAHDLVGGRGEFRFGS